MHYKQFLDHDYISLSDNASPEFNEEVVYPLIGSITTSSIQANELVLSRLYR